MRALIKKKHRLINVFYLLKLTCFFRKSANIDSGEVMHSNLLTILLNLGLELGWCQVHINFDLEDKLDDLQQYTRRQQIIINKCPANTNENTDDIYRKKCCNINVELTPFRSFVVSQFRCFAVLLFRSSVVSHSSFAIWHRSFVISQSRCFVVSLFRIALCSFALLFRCFVLSLFRTFLVWYRPFVVLHFRSFVLSLFRTFVVSYFRCFVLSLFCTFVVLYFRCFVLQLFRTFVVSYFCCFVLLLFRTFFVSYYHRFVINN